MYKRQPIGEEEDSHLGDFIPDEEIQSPQDAATFTLLREQLGDVLDTPVSYTHLDVYKRQV